MAVYTRGPSSRHDKAVHVESEAECNYLLQSKVEHDLHKALKLFDSLVGTLPLCYASVNMLIPPLPADPSLLGLQHVASSDRPFHKWLRSPAVTPRSTL